MEFTERLPDASGWWDRNKVKVAGFAAGMVLPIVISALVVVTYRGYGWGENPPQIAPVYTSF